MSKQIKVGVTLHSYVVDMKKHRITVDEAIRHAASCGAKCIEIVDAEHFLDWPHPKMTDIFHVKDLITSLGMELVNFSQYTENEYSADYRCTEEDKILQVKESILYAHIMGAPMTRLTPFVNVDPADNKVIEKCLPFAEKYNIKLCFEIHSPQKPDKFLRVMKKFKSPYLGLVPDFSAWWYAGHLSLDSFRECLPYTIHVHGKGTSIIDEGHDEPNIPYRDLMAILRDYKYSGSIVAEYEPAGFDPAAADTRKGVESLVKYIYRFI
jgi:sugar phosphate isomerase/epimerase